MINKDGKYIFNIRTANVTVRVSSVFEYTYKRCEKYLVADDEPFDIEISMTLPEIKAFIDKTTAEMIKEGIPIISTSEEYEEFLLLHKRLSDYMPSKNAIMFHCSSIMVDGEAVLFTAKSGTGKSTHSRNWKKVLGERMSYINDDKPYVEVREANEAGAGDSGSASNPAGAGTTVKTRNHFIAHGTPWNGKHDLGEQVSAPIRAIGIITRDEKNFVERVPQMQAFTTIYQQVYFPEDKDMMKRTVEMMTAIANGVPVYRIHCNMEEESARVAYEGIFGKTV